MSVNILGTHAWASQKLIEPFLFPTILNSRDLLQQLIADSLICAIQTP